MDGFLKTFLIVAGCFIVLLLAIPVFFCWIPKWFGEYKYQRFRNDMHIGDIYVLPNPDAYNDELKRIKIIDITTGMTECKFLVSGQKDKVETEYIRYIHVKGYIKDKDAKWNLIN